MKLEFAGATPSPQEVAAIVAVLTLAEPPPQEASETLSGWKLAMRRPELSFDDVRALRRNTHPNV